MITVKSQATLKAIGKLRTEHSKRIDQCLQQSAEIVLKEAIRLVPKDTHELEKSARTKTTGKGFNAKSEVSFETPYAWPVHEDPTAQHEAPTQYKYLTQAVNNRRGTCTNLIKRQMLAKIEGL